MHKYLCLLPVVLFWLGIAQAADDRFACLFTEDRTIRHACSLKLAHAGDAMYQKVLGEIFENGDGVGKDDAQAVYWYRKAAEQGNDDAQLRLGQKLRQGEGAAKDVGQGIDWIHKAADQGNSLAQFALGTIYDKGDGVTKNKSQAIHWYGKIKSKPLVREAQYAIGRIYDDGDGISKDDAQAIRWYIRAAYNFHEDAMLLAGKKLIAADGAVRNVEKGLYFVRYAAKLGNAEAKKYLEGFKGTDRKLGVPSTDRRTKVDLTKEDEQLLDAVGAVFVNNQWTGSGFLISKCHVLTANHVVFDWKNEERDPMVMGKVVKFGVGQTDLKPYKKEIVTGQVVGFDKRVLYEETDTDVERSGDKTKENRGVDRYSELDWALVKLSRSKDGTYLGDKMKPIHFTTQSNGIEFDEAAGYELRSVGQPQDKFAETGKLALWQDPNCWMLISYTSKWYTNCQFRYGMSGGPVVTFRGGGWTAIGLMSMIPKATRGFAAEDEDVFHWGNRMARFDNVHWRRITKAIAENPCD